MNREGEVKSLKKTEPSPFGFNFGEPANSDVQVANKVLNGNKAQGGFFGLGGDKEFIAGNALFGVETPVTPFAFGGKFPVPPKEEKKVEKKPKPSVFQGLPNVPPETKAAPKKAMTTNTIAVVPVAKKMDTQPPIPTVEAKSVGSKKNQLIKKTKTRRKKKQEVEVEQNKDEEALNNEKLAREIIETYNFIKKEVAIFRANDRGTIPIGEILKKPLSESYRILLQDLRFDYMDMKDPNGKWLNQYGTPFMGPPSQAKMIRLAQELADMSTSLPIEHTNSIFIRVDKSRVDLMKALIMGSAKTPYGHGAFEFDIHFEDTYPNAPPKVNIKTTGSGQVRFNPNLYNNGKVCLSLLGTWQGKSGENWNPKLSTILQVLLSIQSLIMTEDIYFNEPGLEVHAGTEHGEMENEGYSNLVRYCNIKYAMIEQIRNPPKGFEAIVKRHFYLKKDEIMEEVNEWIKWADTKKCSYNGCQNFNWQRTFQQSKMKYKEMMVEIAKELKQELDKIPPPADSDIPESQFETKKSGKVEKAKKVEQVIQGEEIDVSYDKEIKVKDLDITDEAVKDRWSRYIGAMGIEAVAKQANSSVFLSGLGGLGVEIAKNIVLSGVKRLSLHDVKPATWSDLSAQFFLEKEDVGKNRAESCLSKLQQLNYYVKVDIVLKDSKLPEKEEELEKVLSGYNVVILTESEDAVIKAVDSLCRKRGIKVIVADVYGAFSRVFTDFGSEFVVVDKNGDEAQEVMIKSITNEKNGLVTLMETNKHRFEDGDEIVITEVQGMKTKDGKDSINGTRHKIKVETAYSFRIGDTTHLSAFEFNGKAKEIKNPVVLEFKDFEEASKLSAPEFDRILYISDFEKTGHFELSHLAFATLDGFRTKFNRRPEAWNIKDANEFLSIATTLKERLPQSEAFSNKFAKFMLSFSLTNAGVFQPLCAFIGGWVSQETVKAITNKFVPIRQLFYKDSMEVIPEFNSEKVEESIQGLYTPEKEDRYEGLAVVIGSQLLKKLSTSKLFMVGVGAIGCELLKNFAMLGTGRSGEGHITITDPDVIETSNLNRQFLFREKHIRKPKSQTAAAAVCQMNPHLKSRITARLDKVHPGTSDIFTDKFFEELTVAANALDNVQARRYMDSRCVKAKTPLLESGTLGPQGHVQVIIPHKTESYASQEDPQDEHDIPHCTLKMFPEETLHCVEWARDKFGKLFAVKPKSLAKLIEDPDFKPTNGQELQAFKEAIKLLKKKPTDFDDCVRYAREKFQKYFVNDIRQLLFTYPLDHKTKEGTPFWSSPKRPPTEILFDPTNPLHAGFIAACACLRAVIFKIPFPNDVTKESGKMRLAKEAAKIKVKDFKPSAEKAKAIATEVSAEKDKQSANTEEEQKAETPSDDYIAFTKEFRDLMANVEKDDKEKLKQVIFPEEFEKDNDKNFHIDFIHALANSRAANYKLDAMDWINVKLKAGRIVPALATTTASIAALQTIEFIKILNENKLSDINNAFMNFAVPILTLSEPGHPAIKKLNEKVSVTIWDRWEFHLGQNASLKAIFKKVSEEYDLECRDVMYEGEAVYFHNLMEMPGKEAEKEKVLEKSLKNLIEIENDTKYVDLFITLAKKGEKDLLKDTPSIRVYFD